MKHCDLERQVIYQVAGGETLIENILLGLRSLTSNILPESPIFGG